MSKLILLGGPPGVGKSTVLACVQQQLDQCAVLDADDVWRVNPLDYSDAGRQSSESNVAAIVREYLKSGREYVVVSWVFASSVLVDRLVAGVAPHFDSHQLIHLVASAESLAERCRRDGGRRPPEYVELKLAQILQLDSEKIDTTSLSPLEAADEVIGVIKRAT